MNQNQQKIFSLIFTIISVFTFVQCAKSQSQEMPTANTSAVPAGSRPFIKGEAAGEVQLFSFKSGDLKTELSNHPAPKVWIVFSTKKKQAETVSPNEAGITKVELTDEGLKEIALLWQVALLTRYNIDIAGTLDWDSYMKEVSKLFKASNKTRNRLMEVEIMSPEGKRTISDDEAGEIIKFINASAADIIAPFKKPKG
jgi:hypothetical protein